MLNRNNIISSLRILLASYFFLGGLFFLFLLIYERGILGLLSTFFPSLFTLSILLFYCIGGLYCFLNTNVNRYKNVLSLCLLIQTLQLSVLGIVFKNYYGLYFAVGFSDTPNLELKFSFKFFTFLFANGFNKNTDEISMMINIIPLGLLIFWLIQTRDISKNNHNV
jgi:hypothetical protein